MHPHKHSNLLYYSPAQPSHHSGGGEAAPIAGNECPSLRGIRTACCAAGGPTVADAQQHAPPSVLLTFKHHPVYNHACKYANNKYQTVGLNGRHRLPLARSRTLCVSDRSMPCAAQLLRAAAGRAAWRLDSLAGASVPAHRGHAAARSPPSGSCAVREIVRATDRAATRRRQRRPVRRTPSVPRVPSPASLAPACCSTERSIKSVMLAQEEARRLQAQEVRPAPTPAAAAAAAPVPYPTTSRSALLTALLPACPPARPGPPAPLPPGTWDAPAGEHGAHSAGADSRRPQQDRLPVVRRDD